MYFVEVRQIPFDEGQCCPSRTTSEIRYIILLEVLLKPGSPYSFGGSPKARQPLFFWRYSKSPAALILLEVLLKPGSPYCPVRFLSDYTWNLMLLCHALTCIQVELMRIWAMQRPEKTELPARNITSQKFPREKKFQRENSSVLN